MDDILKSSVTDPRGEKLLSELTTQDLTALSADDLSERIHQLQSEIKRCEQALAKRQNASAAAEALFKG